MTYKPLIQLNGLSTEELSDELLVCDSSNETAHCLNPFATSVFNLCDGTRTIDEITNEVQEDESLVWQAIYELSDVGIITKPPESLVETDFERRRIVKAAMVGVGILVCSISLPSPATAASFAAGLGCNCTC